MAQTDDIRLPQDTLARELTPEEAASVAGGTFEAVKAGTSSITTGCNPPKTDSDYD